MKNPFKVMTVSSQYELQKALNEIYNEPNYASIFEITHSRLNTLMSNEVYTIVYTVKE